MTTVLEHSLRIKESRGWVLQHFLNALSSYLGPEAGYPDVRFCGFPPSL